MKQIPLSGPDAAWWKMNTTHNRVVITGVVRFAARVEREALVATLREGMAPFAQFRSRIIDRGWRLPLWEEIAGFDAGDYVAVYPSDTPVGFEALEEIAGALMSEPLPEGGPLWRMTLVAEVTGGSAVICRIHHALGDGAALVHFLLSLAQGAPETPRYERRRAGMAWYEPMRFAAATLITPFTLLFKPPEKKNPFRGSLGTQKRAAWTEPFPLDTIKKIGSATGSTVNDVLVAVVTGALRPFLEPLGLRQARAAIPVALRPFGATPELGNRIGIVLLDLPVGVAEPRARIELLKRRMSALKRSPEAFVIFAILWLAGYLPPALARALAWLLGTKVTTVLTNVPGPQFPLTLAGAPISQLMFWVPQAGNCGLGISILSYNGSVTVGVAIDARLSPEPAQVTARVEDEFRRMVESLL